VSSATTEGADVIDRTLDLRNASETSGNYYVIFCARQSKEDKEGVGHAFVVWAEEDQARKRSAARAFGFYPEDGKGTKAVFGDVAGALVNEATKPSGEKLSLVTHRLTVRVNRDRWRESQKEIAQWKTTDYNLFRNNCTHFVHAVAFDLGLIVERPRAEFPSHYLARLIELANSPD
jgi:hypothetical protein